MRASRRALVVAVLATVFPLGYPLRAQSGADSTHTAPPNGPPTGRFGSARWQPWLLGTQVNLIRQQLGPLRAPYTGRNSLPTRGDGATSHAYGVYAGVDVGHGLQGYLDAEMIRGSGISHATGLAGYTNGDVIRQGTVDLGNGPYVARAFVRYTWQLRSATRDTLARGMDQLPMIVTSNRVEIDAGKLAITDYMDVNRYANTTRWQFMNWALINNTAWDYAADTRGYTNGVVVSWIHPVWTFRLGSVQMPTLANGNHFDPDLRRARGDEVELTLAAPTGGGVVRVLAFLNQGRMGNYAEALRRAAQTDSAPNIAADDRPGRTKYGFGVNLEQPLADDGETGLFGRFGWSDGRNESFVFTEVDRLASAGAQASGRHWGRPLDVLGLGGFEHGIVAAHRQYLAAGGLGFLLGDGRLNYAPEQGLESYYRIRLGPFVQVGPDVQLIRNPGYNRDRGTAVVSSGRINLRY